MTNMYGSCQAGIYYSQISDEVEYQISTRPITCGVPTKLIHIGRVITFVMEPDASRYDGSRRLEMEGRSLVQMLEVLCFRLLRALALAVIF